MGTNMREYQQVSYQCSCCEACKNCPAFRKIADVKDDLQIYHHRTSKEKVNRKTESIESNVNFTDAFVFHNTKDVEISSTDIKPKLDQNEVTCPRCKKILEHAHKLILKFPTLAKKDTLGVCDHCRMQGRMKVPCSECEGILKKKIILSINKDKGETENGAKMRVTRIERLLKDEEDIKIEKICAKSDLNIDLHKGAVVREHDVKQMLRSAVLSSDIMLVRKQYENQYKIDNSVIFSDPTHQQRQRNEAALFDKAFLAQENKYTDRTILDTARLVDKDKRRSVIIRDHVYEKIPKDYTFQKTRKFEDPMVDLSKDLQSGQDFINKTPHRSCSTHLGQAIENVKSSEDSILTKSQMETNFKQINIHNYKTHKYFDKKDEDVTKVYKYKAGLLKSRHVTSKSMPSFIKSRTEYKLTWKRDNEFKESLASIQNYNSEESFRSVGANTVQSAVKQDFDYFFPKEIKIEIANPQSRVSSSELIEATQEMMRIRNEEKMHHEEERKRKLEEKERRQIAIAEEKKRLLEEKKRLAETEKQHAEQDRKILEEKEMIEKRQLTQKFEKEETNEIKYTVASKHTKKVVSDQQNKAKHESKVDQEMLNEDNEAEKERKQKDKKEREDRLQKEKEEKLRAKEEKEKLKKVREERLRQEKKEKQKDREANQQEKAKFQERETKQREREAKQQQGKETKQQKKEAKQLEKEAKPPEKESKKRDIVKKGELDITEKMSKSPPVQSIIPKEEAKFKKEPEIDIRKLRDATDKKPKEKLETKSKNVSTPKPDLSNIKTEKDPQLTAIKDFKKEPDKRITKDIDMKKIKIRKPSADDLILNLVKIKQLEQPRKGAKQRRLSAMNISPLLIKAHENHKYRTSNCVICLDSDLELDIESITMKKHKYKMTDVIIGENILRYKLPLVKAKEDELIPALFKSEFKDEPIVVKSKEIVEVISEDTKRISPILMSTKLTKMAEQEPGKGVIRYALSDRSFIDKGWTMLPTEKVVRKMNVYRMRPAHPEFDWFAHNKNKGLMQYDTGEKLAEFDDDGRGRWYYRNGRLALDYYDAEETNAQQRFVVYSSGELDERGRSHPITILATFDYLGNGIVFDHTGKIRLKYNQTEGVVLDRGIGPVSHWKWHTLNDPPVLQQVMIDTQMAQKDPEIIKLGGPHDDKTRPDNDEMLAIEFDNFIKEKSKKLSQTFKPFQIKMKALKINEHFSLRVLDQATIYLIFRDGSTNLKLNIGMILNHQEILDTDTAEVGEVSNNLERFPARTDSLAGLQRSVAYAQRVERARVERERRLRPPEPCASADQLIAAASRALRPPFRSASSTSMTTTTQQCHCNYRKQPSNRLYYDTRFI